MTLSQLEEQFWRAVREELPAEALDQWFKGDERLSAVRRMRIYQHAYWARQENVLAEVFPRLQKHLGAETFSQLAHDYLREHPSTWPAIEWVGSKLPAHLGGCPDVTPHLTNLAELEWARCEALLSPDPALAVELSALRDIDFARARAELSPGVFVLRVRRAALRAYQSDEVDAETLADDVPVGCLVFRQNQLSAHRSLSTQELSALSTLQAGGDFAAVCEVFGEAQEAARSIGKWIHDGLLCNLESR